MKGKTPRCKKAECEAEKLEPVPGSGTLYRGLRFVCPRCGTTYEPVPARERVSSEVS